MDRIDLGQNIEFSRIVYGMWRLGDDADTSPAHVQAKVETCLSKGITTIDQADIYGDYGAEELLGAALKAAPALRQHLEIVTKCDIVAPCGRYEYARVKHYNTSAEHITQSVETSLKNMNIEQIDVLLIHRPDPFMDAEETGGALDALIKQGKIRGAGVSNFRPWDFDLLQTNMENPLLTNQIEFSVTKNDSLTNGDAAHMQMLNVPMMAWSPLGGGDLMADQGAIGTALDTIAKAQDVDRAAVAVAWILAHPARFLPVMGTNTLSRIATLDDALKVEMDRETWFELYEAANGAEVP